MSLFKKVLASVGIGSAKVDTRIASTQIEVGGELRGVVEIQGGQLEQKIDRIYLYLKTQYMKEQNDRKVAVQAEIARFLITEGFLLQPGERRDIPFCFIVPDHTPVTLQRAPVWIETGLDIKNAIDPTDHDHIQVLPHKHMQVVLNALHELGFRLREVSNEYAPRLGRGLPFVQEFEFVPTTHFRGVLDELEVMFYVQGDDLELLLQIDRKARGLSGLLAEALDLDESFVRLTISGGELRRGSAAVARMLRELIARYA